MKYAVAQCSNGNFSIVSEWSDKDKGIVNFHQVCTTLWNAEDVEKACVVLINIDFYVEKIEYVKYNSIPDTAH